MYSDHLCLGCMERKGDGVFCPHCGWKNETVPESALYLTPGVILKDQYLIGRVLGHGGFGITYLAWDLNLNVKLAIKEYLPGTLATRKPGNLDVSVYSGEARGHFDYGLEKFLEEARVLARFQNHPGIVSVVNFFRANETGYIAMSYLEGITLKDYLNENGNRLEFDAARAILMPVMDALREVHSTGMLHRDISPDNIYLTHSKQVKLLDFGAAKYAVGEHSQSLSVILKPGYAPEEQYRTRGHQGPWTDVYALGATFYRAITGQVPPDALDRMERDELKRPSQLDVAMPPLAEHALMKALEVRATNRFRDVATFQNALSTRAMKGREQDEKKAEEKPQQLKKAQSSLLRWRIATAILLFIALFSIIGWAVSYSIHARELSDARRDKAQIASALNEEVQARQKMMKGYPSRQMTITSISVRNEDQKGNSLSLLGTLTRRFSRSEVRYIAFQIGAQNNWAGMKDIEGELGIKYFSPGNKLKQGEASRNGFTYTKTIKMSDKETIKGAWGNSEGGTYLSGTNRIEFWWAGEKIGQISFEVYE